MRQDAVVIVGPVEFGGLAASWVHAGLIGPVLWMRSDVVPDEDDAAAWQQVTVTDFSDAEEHEVLLQRHLATSTPVTSVTIAWLGASGEAPPAGMSALRTFVQRVVHQDTTFRLVHVVWPIDEHQVPDVVQVRGWEQVVVAPEDRPEVNATDAGWLLRRREVILHVAAAVIGRLGGTAAPLPLSSAPRAVSVWSRHVTAADRLRGEVSRFFDEGLPALSAADVEPHQYAMFREEDNHADEVLAWMRALGNCALAYNRAHPESVANAKSASTPDAHVARSDIRSSGDTAAQSAMAPDKVEASAVELIEERLRAEASSAGSLPPDDVWRSVVLALTTSIDGGSLPDGAPTASAHGHRLVVHPNIMWPNGELREHEFGEEANRVVPELVHRPPARIAASAIRRVIAELRDQDGTAPGVPFPALAVSLGQQNRRLVKQSTASDLQLQVSQREELASLDLDDPEEPSAVADRLMRDLLADAIRARLDADRWHRAAVAPRPVATASRLSYRPLWGLAAFLIVMGILWLANEPLMNSLLGGIGLGPWSPSAVAAVSWGAAAGIGIATALVQRRRTRVDWRFRRMLRELLAAQARQAYADTGRLFNALNVLTLWRRILVGVFPHADGSAVEEAAEQPSVPESLQLGPLDMYVPFQNLQLGRSSAPPGWRWRALDELAGITLAKYDDMSIDGGSGLDRLWSDSGYREGPLHRVARDLPWRELRSRWIDLASATAKADLAKSIPTLVGGQGGQGLRSFLDELNNRQTPLIWSALPVRGTSQETYKFGSHLSGEETITLTPTLFAVTVLVVTRPLPRNAAVHPADESDDPGPDVL